jgi:hypothetical protein
MLSRGSGDDRDRARDLMTRGAVDLARGTVSTLIVVTLAGCAASPGTSGVTTTAPAPATSAPANVTVGVALLSDNLYRDNGRDWPVGESEGASQSFDIGHAYVVQLGGTARATYPGPSFAGIAREKLSDYVVDVQATDVVAVGPQDAVGVFCRHAPPSTQLYSFVIRFGVDGAETYEIWRDDKAAGAQPRKLASDTARPNARASTKTLRAACIGGQGGPATLVFYVDARHVLRATDERSPLTAGLAGLVLWRGSSSTAGTAAKFSFFTVAPATLGP